MKKETMQKSGVVLLLAMICCALWGSAFPSIKIGYQLFHIAAKDSASQILFAGARFFLAGVLVLLLGSIIGKKLLVPKKEDIGKIVILAIFQTILQYVFFYIGLASTTGVKSSIITASNVFLAILIASLIFHQEKLTSKKIVGCLVGFAGIVLINMGSGSIDMSFRWDGDFLILLSALAAATSSVLIKRFSANTDPVLLSGWQFCLGGIVMAGTGILMGGNLHFYGPSCAILLFYMGIISAVAYTLWSILLKYNPLSKVAVFGFMNPVFGVMLSAVLLKENGQAFTWRSLTSLVLVCIGIYVVNSSHADEKC